MKTRPTRKPPRPTADDKPARELPCLHGRSVPGPSSEDEVQP
jgi:hypothetical protein